MTYKGLSPLLQPLMRLCIYSYSWHSPVLMCNGQSFLIVTGLCHDEGVQIEEAITSSQWSFRKLTTMGTPTARNSRRRSCPLPSRLGGLGSVVSSPSGVRAGAPAANMFSHSLGSRKHLFGQQNAIKKHIVMCLCSRGTVFGTVNYITSQSIVVNKGNAIPMRSKGILTMGTAFPRVPPRNDHCLLVNGWMSVGIVSCFLVVLSYFASISIPSVIQIRTISHLASFK